MRVKEWQGEVVFLHEVVPGAADRSYGIQVAKLAGLPASVIERAKLVLAKLEAEDRASPRGFDDLPLFAAAPKAAAQRRSSTTRWRRSIAALAAINPDEMSPREALEALYRLKAKSVVKVAPSVLATRSIAFREAASRWAIFDRKRSWLRPPIA